MEQIKKRNIILGIVLVILLIIGVSYAYWSITHTQTNTNVVKTGCFNITFTSGSGISMNNALPITDTEGKTTTPYHFTITNTCNSPASYQINLETLNTSTLANQYVKAVLNKQGPRLLTKYDEVETTISTATNSYKLYKGTLQPLQTKEYDLRIWMDYDTTTIQGSNKTFSSKIVIIAVPKVELPVLMAENYDPLNTASYLSSPSPLIRNKIDTVTITNTKTVPLDALDSWDVSAAGDGSVMAWYKDAASGTSGMYDVWIGGNGGVSANSNSSYLFSNLINVKLLDVTYLDTSNVINMKQMFYQAGNYSHTALIGVENWDVSSVINMNLLFRNLSFVSSTSSLDLSNWDVSNVTDMSQMFCLTQAYYSTDFTLNLSYWDVSNVTDMSNMFSGSFGVKSNFNLTGLEDWDVSNVKTMYAMFSTFSESNTTLSIDLSDWNTSNVINMESMFQEACILCTTIDLDLSNWDISKVSYMSLMFAWTLELRNLHLDNWAVPTANKADMFLGSNNNSAPDNSNIYVKNPSLGTWLSSTSNFPSGAQIILVP